MNQEFLDAVSESVRISQQKWIEWQHEMKGIIHCGTCLALHECWFVFGNEPSKTVAISTTQVKNNAEATSKYSKFDPYLFDPKNFYRHGKNKAFESWGYTIEDSAWL